MALISKAVVSGATGPTARRAWPRGVVSEKVTSRARGFQWPVADPVVEGLDLAGLNDVRVVAQPGEQLGAVGLAVDGGELVALDVRVALGAVGQGVIIDPVYPLSEVGQRGQGAEVRPRVRRPVGLVEEVVAVGVEVLLPAWC